MKKFKLNSKTENRTFGVELEYTNCAPATLASALRNAGINTHNEAYTHRTTEH